MFLPFSIFLNYITYFPFSQYRCGFRAGLSLPAPLRGLNAVKFLHNLPLGCDKNNASHCKINAVAFISEFLQAKTSAAAGLPV